jgi:hypothetical protein
MIAAAEVFDCARYFLAWPASFFGSTVILTIPAVCWPVLDVPSNNFTDLCDWLWQMRLDAIEHSAIEIQATDAMGWVDWPSHFNAFAFSGFAANELPAISAMRANLRAQRFLIEVQDNSFIQLGFGFGLAQGQDVQRDHVIIQL